MSLMNKKDIDFMSDEDKRDCWSERNDQWNVDESVPRPIKKYGRWHYGPDVKRPWWFTLIEILIFLCAFAAFLYFATKM